MASADEPIRLWSIPFSTNVERVRLALGHKGLAYEVVTVDPDDRAELRRVSGQDLVPVLEDGGEVIHDSLRILEHLERVLLVGDGTGCPPCQTPRAGSSG